MIPLVSMMKEMKNQGAIVRQRGGTGVQRKGTSKLKYLVGTMIELPRACSVADRDRRGR